MSNLITKIFPKYGSIDKHIPDFDGLVIESTSVAPMAKDIIPDYISELASRLERVSAELAVTNDSIAELTLKKKSLNLIKMTLEASLSTAESTLGNEVSNG